MDMIFHDDRQTGSDKGINQPIVISFVAVGNFSLVYIGSQRREGILKDRKQKPPVVVHTYLPTY